MDTIAKVRAPRLSKSRIQYGRQCHKRLWLSVHAPDAAELGDAAQARLDEGTRFGELAQELLGGGLLIEADHLHAREALAQTRDALGRSRTDIPRLFEAAFEHRGVRVRVDALERGRGGDTLIEVKSTTEVKDEYLWDCAIQVWVARGASRPIRWVKLAHVNRDFVYTTPGDYSGLLRVQDITKEVEALLPKIPRLVGRLKKVVTGAEPEIATGAHCSEPYDCPFLAYCQSKEPAPPDFPVSLLPRAGKVVNALQGEGYRDLRDVPDESLEREQHKRIATATRDNRPFVSPNLAATLDAIPYPRHYLDFETIRFVIPRWLGTRPFEQLPFQFSCHVETAPGEMRHEAFLDVTGDSPLATCAERLVDVLGDQGPIIAWNKGFEAGCIRGLAERFPQHRAALLGSADRLVDLLPIYRDHYYHRNMLGSWSIKAVLPTIAPDLDYGDLEVGDGSAAQIAWLEAANAQTTAERREALRSQLLAYCERDTLAMVRLAQWRS